jgi:inosine-uridine nucleoside N-ribohydrolase
MRRIALGVLLSATALSGAGQIIFDTDSGFFGDDGAALVMLLRSPKQANILGITVVPGNVWTGAGAEYMRQILKLAGNKKTPVYAGAQAPLVHTAAMVEAENRHWGPVHYRGAFEREFHAAPRLPDAIRFLIDAINRQPGRVTVLALGPMTNLAIAMRLDPDLDTKIKRIVWMGGTLTLPGNSTESAEFNFWFDPEAAQVVFRSRIPEKVMFGLDVCKKAVIDKARFDEIVAVKTPVTLRFAEDMGNRYPGFYRNPESEVSMWDALVSAYIIDPATATKLESAHLDIDTRFGKTYGAVIPLDKALAPQATPVRVVWDVDVPRAWTMYKRLLTQ